MAKNGKRRNAKGPKLAKGATSLAYAAKGITTGHDFANFMSALMSDLIAGRVSPGIGNAACNAGGKLLKVVEMQLRYGTQEAGGRVLKLAMDTPLLPADHVQ